MTATAGVASITQAFGQWLAGIEAGAASVVLVAVVAVLMLALVGVYTLGRHWRGVARQRGGQDEDRGSELLRMAREIDRRAEALEWAGQSSTDLRRWARTCRELAAEQLVRINAALLEELRGGEDERGSGRARRATSSRRAASLNRR